MIRRPRRSTLFPNTTLSRSAVRRAEPPDQLLRRKRPRLPQQLFRDRKSTRLNSSHGYISYAVFCLKKKNASHVGQLGVHQDHVRLGRARALERVLGRALLEHGVPAALQQHSEPARPLLAVAGEKHEWQSALWHSLRHAQLPPTACDR